MKKSLYYYPLAIVILAVILTTFGWFSESTTVRWIAPAFGLALIAIGLGVNSLIIVFHTEKRVDDMGAAIARIEGLAEEMRNEQKEQKNTGPPVVASIEAISKYYMDYISQQKGKEKK